MFRKRQRSHQSNLNMGNNMVTHTGQRLKTSSIFGTHVPSVGYSTKTYSFRIPNFAPPDFKKIKFINPFSFRSSENQNVPDQERGYCCPKVGLGIINSLTDKTEPSGAVSESSKKGKNIVIGPQLKLNNIPTSTTHFAYFSDSCLGINPLPRDSMVCPNLGGSDVVYGPGESSASASASPFLSDHSLPPSHLKYFHPGHKPNEVVSPPLIGGSSSSSDHSPTFTHNSLPVTNVTGQTMQAFLTPFEIELSEEYTRVTFNGPKRRVTHIFGDTILGYFPTRKNEPVSVSYPVAMNGMNNNNGSNSYPFDEEFLKFCYSCKKKLHNGHDIYIYRGERSFCSNECRLEEIAAEKNRLIAQKTKASESASRLSNDDGVIFQMD